MFILVVTREYPFLAISFAAQNLLYYVSELLGAPSRNSSTHRLNVMEYVYDLRFILSLTGALSLRSSLCPSSLDWSSPFRSGTYTGSSPPGNSIKSSRRWSALRLDFSHVRSPHDEEISVSLTLHRIVAGINSSVFSTFILCIVSQFWLRKYHPRWFRKYNFLMSAALDGGELDIPLPSGLR